MKLIQLIKLIKYGNNEHSETCEHLFHEEFETIRLGKLQKWENGKERKS